MEQEERKEQRNLVEAGQRRRGHYNTTLPIFIFFVLTGIGSWMGWLSQNLAIIPGAMVAAGLLASSVKVAAEWERAVVLRFGKFIRVAGPGLFFSWPFIESISHWIDQRIQATQFTAEETLTKDNVPVDVDAVLFWLAWDAKRAALEVADYEQAVSWAAQTALRDVIGKTELSQMLAGREHLDEMLQQIIDERTEPWGIAVQSVEIRDVVIPASLQDAMSREAQAERERRARIILGTAENEIAEKLVQAADVYKDNPIALQLRAMNILYEGLKERGGLMVVPSDISNSLNVHGIGGLWDRWVKQKDTES